MNLFAQREEFFFLRLIWEGFKLLAKLVKLVINFIFSILMALVIIIFIVIMVMVIIRSLFISILEFSILEEEEI